LDSGETRPVKVFCFEERGTIHAALVFVFKRNVLLRADLPEAFEPQLDQREIFEIDRSNMVLQLRSLRRAIEEGAEEMEMVAVERVFSKSLSAALIRNGQKLRLIAKDVNRVLHLIERAHAPNAPKRPDLTSKASQSKNGTDVIPKHTSGRPSRVVGLP
jgi:hypothetical protein